MFSGIGKAMVVMFIVMCISLPLGIWKLIEIIAWAINHISISVK